MGNNNFQKKKKRNNNGYFTRNIQQFGEDFLSKKTAKDIQNDYRYIFKDIAYSNPEDVSTMVPYFMNSTFVYNLNLCAYNEWCTKNATYIGLQTYIQNCQIQNIPMDHSMRLDDEMLKAQQSAIVYEIISSHLNNILSLLGNCADMETLILYVEANLKALSVQLSKYKRII